MASQLVGRERRDFWTLSFGQFLLFCGFFSYFQLPLYIKALGGGEIAIGVIMGVLQLASTLLLPWIIATVDRVERKQLMLAGMVLLEVSTIAFLTTGTPGVYMAFLMLSRGLGFTIYMNASGAYIAAILPPREKARWIGINFGFNQIAIGLGPALGELAITHVNFPFFFFMSTAFVYAGMLLILPITAREPVRPTAPFRAVDSLVSFFQELFGPRFRNSFFTLVFVAAGLGATFNFTATYTQLLGLSSGMFFAVYALFNVLCRFFGAGLADRYGRGLVVIPTLALMAVGLAVYSFTTTVSVLLVAAVLIGVGFGLSNPAILAQMLDRSPQHLQAMAIGLFHFAYQLGLLSSAPIWGAVADAAGYRMMWWLASASVIVATGLFLLPQPHVATVEEELEPADGAKTILDDMDFPGGPRRAVGS